MIPLNFYRDDEYVYYNNPNGITKKMSIADFESAMGGSSGGSVIITKMDMETYKIPYSYKDIQNLIAENKSLIVCFDDVAYFYLARIDGTETPYSVYFISVGTGGANININTFYSDNDSEYLTMVDD